MSQKYQGDKMSSLGLAIVVCMSLLVPSLISRGSSRMTANEKAMNSEVAHKMGDEIGKAKPGAIMVAYSGDLLHVEWANGGYSNGHVTYNGVGNDHAVASLNTFAWRIMRVINQDEPGYNELARRYLRGDKVDPHPLEPPR